MNRNFIVTIILVIASPFVVIAEQTSQVKVGRNLSVLTEAYRSVYGYYVDVVDADELLESSMEGMTAILDPYSSFISEEEMKDFQLMTTGKYGGIGSLIREKSGSVYIAQPYEGTPADRAGLKIGDKIVAIDGVDAKKFKSSEVSSRLKGDPGTEVVVEVEKYMTGNRETYRIMRERISIPGVPYYEMLEGGVGYICHNDFTEHSSSDMHNALMELKKRGELNGLVLDYRGNGGGILQEAVKILSMFVPKGTEVVSMRGRDVESHKVFKTTSDPIDLTTPIVVLVSGGTASSAEIVAGALQDLDRAVLVGQRSFGKGLVQSTRPLGFGSYIKLTMAKYYLPSGRCVQAIDYAKRDDEGNVDYIPDSLIVEYTTLGGRKVYDGAGVMPDVRQKTEYVSKYAILLYYKGYIDDFAGMYAKKYRDTPVIPTEFSLSSEDYEWFKEYISEKTLEYESDTAESLKTIKKSAEKELYIDAIAGELERIEQILKEERMSNMNLYRADITAMLEEAIVLRDNYDRGVRRHKMVSDQGVELAVQILADAPRYEKIVTSQDTDKK